MHLHLTVSLSSLIKDTKVSSSLHIKEKNLFNDFTGWQEGYGTFTYSVKEKDRLNEYGKNQEDHYKTKSFKDEFIELLHEHGI